ncbi:MAG TPA: hypothetical protein VF186_06450 [Gaiellaceae bacterium]|jgi:hypothetical protein
MLEIDVGYEQPRRPGGVQVHTVQPKKASPHPGPSTQSAPSQGRVQSAPAVANRQPRPADAAPPPSLAGRVARPMTVSGAQPRKPVPAQVDSHHGLLGTVEHVGAAVAAALEHPAAVVHAATRTAPLRAAIDVAAVRPYLEYYAAYRVAEAINAAGSKGGRAGSIVSHALAAPLTIPEAVGLAQDVLLDEVKGESIHDEQFKHGYVNPLHSFLPPWLRGPRTYLPGVGKDSIDFEW